jgi:hypothetical protein
MADAYRLRLRDGTILTVDHAGLRTWLLDDRAMVQPAGSTGWRGLKEFLESEARRPAPPRPPARPPASPPAPRPETIDLADVARDALMVPIAEAVSAAPTPTEELPTIPLKPLPPDEALQRASGPPVDADDVHEEPRPAPTQGFVEKAVVVVKALLAAVRTWLRSARQRPPVRPAPASALPPQARRGALTPPPSIHELPVLRLAPIDDDAPADDVYRADRARVVWPRVKRWLPVAVLAAVVVLVAVTLPEWLGRLKPASPRPAVREGVPVAPLPTLPSSPEPKPPLTAAAVRSVATRLPHLAPETVRRLMSDAGSGVPDAALVFRRAHAAAQRGRSSLRASEAQELWDLEQAALTLLRPDEQKRLRTYQRVGAAGSSTEDARALALVAKATGRLSHRSRQRLQALLGKAIGAALSADAVPPLVTASSPRP